MSEYGFTHPISVRIGDIDFNEHVNNTAYTRYAQEARVHYFRHLLGEDQSEATVVIASLEIDYLAPIHFEDEVSVDVRVTDVGESSWTVDFRIRAVGDAERVAARGSSVQVARDRDGTSAEPLPQRWREALAAERDALGA